MEVRLVLLLSALICVVVILGEQGKLMSGIFL
jgi:hypothetical protein